MKTKNILFRADSSSTIGTGHIMRDLVLAEQFKDAEIIFATQELKGNINHKILEKGYTLKTLTSNTVEELTSLIKELSIDMIVIDHYGIDYAFEKKLKEKTGIKIMVLDDTYEKHHCDILLNHNIYAEEKKYKDLVPSHCELRCGEKFTLLRKEFRIEKKKKRKNLKETINILIAMGGTDHLNISTKILHAVKSLNNLNINIVSTSVNTHLPDLQKILTHKSNVTLHINVNYIAKLMNNADLAIISPSVTMNEIFYMKVPFISIKTADNQNEMHNYLIKNNFISMNEFDKYKFVDIFTTYIKEEINV